MNLGGGTPQNFCTFDTPYHPCFIAFLRKNFRKFSKFVLLILAVFSKNFPKFPKKIVKFFQFFQNRKNNNIFELRLVQNHHVDQNLVKFPPQKYKNGQFFLENCYFFKFFGAFGAENLYF